ncbi:MAG: hypothetical protein ACLFQK_07840 [Fibrobacterota bacterium]
MIPDYSIQDDFSIDISWPLNFEGVIKSAPPANAYTPLSSSNSALKYAMGSFLMANDGNGDGQIDVDHPKSDSLLTYADPYSPCDSLGVEAHNELVSYPYTSDDGKDFWIGISTGYVMYFPDEASIEKFKEENSSIGSLELKTGYNYITVKGDIPSVGSFEEVVIDFITDTEREETLLNLQDTYDSSLCN